jgi:hypothetical protein
MAQKQIARKRISISVSDQKGIFSGKTLEMTRRFRGLALAEASNKRARCQEASCDRREILLLLTSAGGIAHEDGVANSSGNS